MDPRKPPFDVLSEAQNAAVSRALSEDPEARFETCGDAARAVAEASPRVPERVLARDIEAYARELRARLRREHARPMGTHTTRVGGVVKTGRSLERLLLAMYLWLASQEGFDPVAELRSQNVYSIHKATSGRLAGLIQKRSTCTSATRPELAVLVEDLRTGNGRIDRLINLRNKAAHQGVLGSDLQAASAQVAALLDAYLQGLGAPS